MPATQERMSPRKRKLPVDPDKPVPFYLKMDPRIRKQLDQMANDLASEVTTEVKTAIRERLERLGYWPPKSE